MSHDQLVYMYWSRCVRYISIRIEKHRGAGTGTHHVANISTAIHTADAQTILNAASACMLRVSVGVM